MNCNMSPWLHACLNWILWDKALVLSLHWIRMCCLQTVRQKLYDEITKINQDRDWSFILKQIGEPWKNFSLIYFSQRLVVHQNGIQTSRLLVFETFCRHVLFHRAQPCSGNSFNSFKHWRQMAETNADRNTFWLSIDSAALNEAN